MIVNSPVACREVVEAYSCAPVTTHIHKLQLDDTTVPLSCFVKSVGVLLDSTLSSEYFISQTPKSCHYLLRRISAVRKYLFIEATVKLATPLIISRLVYCNSLLSGLPDSSVNSLRHIENYAARFIPKIKK